MTLPQTAGGSKHEKEHFRKVRTQKAIVFNQFFYCFTKFTNDHGGVYFGIVGEYGQRGKYENADQGFYCSRSILGCGVCDYEGEWPLDQPLFVYAEYSNSGNDNGRNCTEKSGGF